MNGLQEMSFLQMSQPEVNNAAEDNGTKIGPRIRVSGLWSS